MTETLRQRNATIIGPVDVQAAVGIEIGALNNPLVRRSEGKITYVDYADTETLRKHPFDHTVDPADIVDVDVVWDQRPLADCVNQKFDYAVAAHVIEHVPDVIGWLHDLHSVLKPTGTLGLAIPDRRFTFDYARQESAVGEMVEAHLLRYRMPSIRQVFDFCHLAVRNELPTAWASQQNAALMEKFNPVALPLAYAQARELAIKPRYIDTHCWVFTPNGWLDNLDVLADLSLLPFKVTFIRPPLPDTLEFIMRLRPCDPTDAGQIKASIAAARRVVEADVNEQKYKMIPARRVAESRIQTELASAQRELDNERARRAAIEQSTSWRMTAPLRSLVSKVKRGAFS